MELLSPKGNSTGQQINPHSLGYCKLLSRGLVGGTGLGDGGRVKKISKEAVDLLDVSLIHDSILRVRKSKVQEIWGHVKWCQSTTPLIFKYTFRLSSGKMIKLGVEPKLACPAWFCRLGPIKTGQVANARTIKNAGIRQGVLETQEVLDNAVH